MARRLTTFSKLVITLLIIAALFFGFQYLLKNTDLGNKIGSNASKDQDQAQTDSDRPSANNSRSFANDDDVLKVQLVTWGGYAPGLYFNEGSEPSTRSRFYKDYGLKVQFIKNDDLINALNAWIADEYDVLVQTADAFPLYTAPDDINQYKPTIFMQVDWSRGGDVIIAKRGINSINDLKGKKVAVTEPSPSQTLLITALEAAGMDYTDVEISPTQDPIFAAQSFKAQDIDAAVVWSPFHFEALNEIPGSKVLITSKEQSHIIADIMFAKEDFINSNRDKINAFYEGWMKGVAELYTNESNQEKAAKILAEFLEFSIDDAKGAMADVRWTTHGDNRNFFGLNGNYKGMKGSNLYDKMATKFYQLEQAEKVAPPWRSVISTTAVQNFPSNLTGEGYAAEGTKSFEPATEEDKSAPAISSKQVSINFATGQSALTENAKTIIDLQFADIARSFSNLRIRIEGNTDNTGSRATNMALSEHRARSVANYLQRTYGLDPNRFVILGNGPDNPVTGCEDNSTPECRAKNRRTDFQLLAE